MRNGNNPKPVEKVEVNEKHVVLRIVLFVLATLLAVGAFAYAIIKLLTVEKGWREITAESAKMNCGSDFTFYYDLGSGEQGATEEKKALTVLYTGLCENAYALFNEYETDETVNNVRSVNENVNRNVEVDQALYNALKTAADNGRYLFYAPYYEVYMQMSFASYDYAAESYDPTISPSIAEFFERAAEFISSPLHVDLYFSGNGNVRLFVSDEYLEFARENGIDVFMGFGWMKNAFICDYLVDSIVEKGYTHGYIASEDGFYRGLGSSPFTMRVPSVTETDNEKYVAGNIDMAADAACVLLKNYYVSSGYGFYQYSDGRVVTPYSGEDGYSKTACESLMCYSSQKGCGYLAIKAASAYIADRPDNDLLNDYVSEDVYTVYVKGTTIYYNRSDAPISELYSGDFTVEKELF